MFYQVDVKTKGDYTISYSRVVHIELKKTEITLYISSSYTKLNDKSIMETYPLRILEKFIVKEEPKSNYM